VAGLRKNISIYDFKDYISKFDVINFSETWLKHNEEVIVNNYFHLAQVGPQSQAKGQNPGGVLSLIKDKYSKKCENIKTELYNVICYHTCISNFNMIIISVYNPPEVSKYTNKNLFNDLKNLIIEQQAKYPDIAIIVGGDFNARIAEEKIHICDIGEVKSEREGNFIRKSRDKYINKEGKKLLSFCEEIGMVILNGCCGNDTEGNFTCLKEKGASVVDYILITTNLLPYLKDFYIDARAESDHMPLVLEITLPIYQDYNSSDLASSCKTIDRYKWDSIKKDDFVNSISNSCILSNIENKLHYNVFLDCNLLIDNIDNIILKEGLPMKMYHNTKKERKYSNNHWFDKECERVKQELARANRRRCRKNSAHNSAMCHEIRVKFQKLKETKITAWKEKRVAEVLDIISRGSPTDLWGLLRKFKGFSFIKNNINPQEWMAHFKKVLGGVTVLNTRLDISHFRYVYDLDSPFEETDLIDALRSLKNNKAPGIDGIPAEFYKFATGNKDIITSWLQSFNALFAMGEYHCTWETSIIHTIFKNKGDKNSPDNYRGIALAPILSKVFCKLLYNKLQKWTQKENKISMYQAGFRPGYSTVDNIFVLDHIIKKYLSRKKGKLYCAFIDFQKAFDSVNRKKLWARLWQIGCSTKMLEALMGIYNSVKFSIKCDTNKITEPVYSYQGVKQGCILSPLLFILFIDDILDDMKFDTDTPLIGVDDELQVPGLLYADDLMLISISIGGLQTKLDKLKVYCERADLTVHTGKTNVICFKNGPTLSRNEVCTFSDARLETVRSVVYLGMCISMSGKWTQHINKAILKAKKAAGAASSILYKCIEPPLKLCNQLYVSHVESVALYGAEIWGVENVDKTVTVQSSFYKRILCLARSTSHYGILRESGNIDIRIKAQNRSLMYWLRCAKDLAPPLVARCYREQIHQGVTWVHKPWALKIKDLLQHLSLESLWQGEGLNSTSVYTKLQTELFLRNQAYIINQCNTMSSLRTIRTDVWGVPFFMTECNRNTRSNLLWFWLGGFITNKFVKIINDTKVATCPLCMKEETACHILLQCHVTSIHRIDIFHKINKVDLCTLRASHDISLLNALGKYISVVRAMRSEALANLRKQHLS
jgi:exonuclease III